MSLISWDKGNLILNSCLALGCKGFASVKNTLISFPLQGC